MGKTVCKISLDNLKIGKYEKTQHVQKRSQDLLNKKQQLDALCQLLRNYYQCQ